MVGLSRSTAALAACVPILLLLALGAALYFARHRLLRWRLVGRGADARGAAAGTPLPLLTPTRKGRVPRSSSVAAVVTANPVVGRTGVVLTGGLL